MAVTTPAARVARNLAEALPAQGVQSGSLGAGAAEPAAVLAELNQEGVVGAATTAVVAAAVVFATILRAAAAVAVRRTPRPARPT